MRERLLLLRPAGLMLLGTKPLIFKVAPVSTGSDTLVVGTEEMPPQNRIPTHKHLHEDEVILVHKDAVRVTLNDQQYDAGTSAAIFIPHGTWDRRREHVERYRDDSVLLQQARIRAVFPRNVVSSRREVHPTASGKDESRSTGLR